MIHSMRAPRRRAWSAALAVLAGLTVTLAWSGTARAATFGPPVIITGDQTGEPGINIAPDGTIYVNAPAGLLSDLPGSPSFVYRSTDGGSTWVKTPPDLRGLFPGGGDSNIAVDPATGEIYMTDLWLGSATVSFSTDRGETWTANPVEGVVVQDRQWISTTGGGNVYHLTHQIPAGLVVSKSVDGGATFPIQTLAATPVDQTGCICPSGPMISEGGIDLLGIGLLGLGDKIGFVYATSVGGVGFAGSTDGGLLFTNSDVSPPSSADSTQAFPVVANAGGGHLVAVWMEIVGNSSRVQFADSTDWGSTWSPPRTLVDAGTSVYPWIAASGLKVAVSLYHTDATGTPGTVPAGAGWFESYLESTDGGGTFSGLQIVDPTPVKSGPICTAGIDCTGNRELLDFQSVALDGGNRANLVWTHSIDNVSNTELRFARQQ